MTKRRIGKDIYLIVLIAPAYNATLLLLDLRWQPWNIEMMQGFQTGLDIDARDFR